MTGFLLKRNWAGLVKKSCRDEPTLFNVPPPEYGGGQRPAVIKRGKSKHFKNFTYNLNCFKNRILNNIK